MTHDLYWLNPPRMSFAGVVSWLLGLLRALSGCSLLNGRATKVFQYWG